MSDGSFGVEVTIPDRYPTKVSGFATKAAAHAWITKHKRRVAESDLFRAVWRANALTREARCTR